MHTMSAPRCVVAKGTVLGCAKTKRQLAKLLRACCRDHGKRVCRIRGALPLGLTRTTLTKAQKGLRETRFENGWKVRTFFDHGRKKWATRAYGAGGKVMASDLAPSMNASEDVHEKMVTAVERYAEPGIDAAEFRERKAELTRPESVVPSTLSPLVGARKRRRGR